MFHQAFGSPRSRADRFARYGLAACLLLLAAGVLGGRYVVLDLVSLVAAPLALASILFSVFLLLRARSWKGRVLMGVCCIPGILLVAPERPDRTGCSASAERLRVAWINAHHPERPDRIARWLEQERPQVVGVAELRSDLALTEVLRKRYPYWQSCLRNGRCSTLLYSSVAPAKAESLARGDPENRKALSAVRMAFGAEGRGGAQIFAVHLSRPLPLGRQRSELLELEEHLGASAGAIVMGDMNMSPRMRLLRDFAGRNGLHLARMEHPTWPIEIRDYPLPGLWQIDHLLVGREWTVAAIRTGPDVGSDHKGFVADLCRDTD